MQAISKTLLVLAGFSFSVGCLSCKTLENADKDAESPPVDNAEQMMIPVGTIHVVRSDENFVLIKSTRFLQIEPGTNLTVMGQGGIETARLQVSPARKGQFVTADIISGLPLSGNQVLMNYVAKREASPAAGAADSPDEIQVLE